MEIEVTPPRGRSAFGGKPANGDTVTTPEGTAAEMYQDLVRHYRAEIDRLNVLLRAEQNHARRLSAAVAHLKEGYGILYGAVRLTHHAVDCDAIKEIDGSAFTEITERANDALEVADENISPIAVEG